MKIVSLHNVEMSVLADFNYYCVVLILRCPYTFPILVILCLLESPNGTFSTEEIPADLYEDGETS